MIVKLMKGPGADKVVAKDRTDEEGEYIFVRQPEGRKRIHEVPWLLAHLVRAFAPLSR